MIKLEPILRVDLERIAQRERTTVVKLCELVMVRLEERHRRHGDVPDVPAALAPALGRLVASYDRHTAEAVTKAMQALNCKGH